MTGPDFLAVGIGCRAGAEAAAIVALIEAAIEAADLPDLPIALFTIAEKRAEVGIAEAAARLGLPLVHLPKTALEAVADRIETRSERVIELFGVPSIAEGAALAGAGRDPRLVVPRRAARGVTVAVARPGLGREEPS